MKKTIAVVMDPIESIKSSKDTSFALLLEAQSRGYSIYYVEPGSLNIDGGHTFAYLSELIVKDDISEYFKKGPSKLTALSTMSVILMRKDPPVDDQFIYDTQILSLAESEGVLVVNSPQGLRDMNEKLTALLFPQCCPETLVSRNKKDLKAFIHKHRDTVLKPLDGMGGKSIFRVKDNDSNINVILETLTANGAMALAQKFIPEIEQGDKRILLVDGVPVPYTLARIPQGDEFRGNLAAGGKGEGRPLSERDRWIANEVGPWLKERGMLLVGLDVIGDYLTEVNVTSPTCVRELDAQFGLNIAALVFDAVEKRLPLI
ncbi:MAG: glutathione synthase [Arenimonas sp.]|nr:glutathione synthase [Arenimonas sp.]MBP6309391.1 glutathione synthase [Arenimonas sp.]